jgi:hypothetical protein
LGGDVAANDGESGTATATAATTLTDGAKAWTTDQWAGHIVHVGAAYGVIASNVATVLTIDKWYNPADPGAAAASTPSGTSPYHISYGMFPAAWVGVSESVSAIGGTETTLTGELAGSGWDRRLCTWAHSAGVATYTLTTTFTSADGSTRTIGKAGFFNSSRVVTGAILMFLTLVSPTATLISGDQLTLTETVSI